MNFLTPKRKNIAFFLSILIIFSIFTGEAIFIMKNTSTKVDPHPNLSNIQSNVTSDMLGITSCFSKTDLDYQKCMDTFIEDYFVTTGKTTKQVLADLDKSRSDSLIESSCHPVSHTIGRITFKRTQNIGDAFEACDQTCSSGCYHGVMERMFFSDEELSSSFKHLSYSSFETKIPGICDKDKFSNPNPAIIFNCLHGVGHAVMYSLDYNLDESLRVCGIFNTEYARSSCYGGVIMENVTGFDKKKRDLKADDPLYPCDRLEEKFLRDCYTMQTSVMTEQGLSNEQIIQECRKAGDFAPNCFVSMGRDLSNHVREGYGEYTAKECEAAGEDWSSCMQGAIYALIDFSWDLGKSSILCNAFSLQSHVEECYRSQVAYFGSAYAKTNEEIDDNCRSFAERNQDYCLSIDREI